MIKVIEEMPKLCCEEGRHAFGREEYVYVKLKFLYFTWVAGRTKMTCALCKKVEYFSPCNGM